MLRDRCLRIFLESGQTLIPKALLDLLFIENSLGIKEGISSIGIEDKSSSVKP